MERLRGDLEGIKCEHISPYLQTSLSLRPGGACSCFFWHDIKQRKVNGSQWTERDNMHALGGGRYYQHQTLVRPWKSLVKKIPVKQRAKRDSGFILFSRRGKGCASLSTFLLCLFTLKSVQPTIIDVRVDSLCHNCAVSWMQSGATNGLHYVTPWRCVQLQETVDMVQATKT